jgi:hypothetical protein
MWTNVKKRFIIFCVAVHDQWLFPRQNFLLLNFMKIRHGMYGVGENPYYGWAESGIDCIFW